MTDEEALALKCGDRVEVRIVTRDEWVEAFVRMAYRFRGSQRVHVKVERRSMPPGSRLKTFALKKRPEDVRFPLTDAAPEPANVYADFLEESGFSDAAAALRRAFPLDDGRVQ